MVNPRRDPYAYPQQKVKFMDATNRNYPKVTHRPSYPTGLDEPMPIHFQYTHKKMFHSRDIGNIANISRMQAFTTEFCSFPNRYYNSQFGAESSEWIFSQISESIVQSGYRGNATVRYFVHSWAQKSIIARIQGTESGVVILGAHQDSINRDDPTNGTAPGADDNASGTVALLEVFRILLGGFFPASSIEFHWYAAEEGGLLGSQDIAQAYFNERVDVLSMLNLDGVGYYEGHDKVAIVTDYTDIVLNAVIRSVVKYFLKFTWTDSICGYACSDHASWNKYGFPAAAAISSSTNKSANWHTIRDTIDHINFTQVQEFVKLAYGYAIVFAGSAQ